MYADIEALVLSGELFNGPARSSSPTRSASPDEDPGWHDDEYIAEQQKQHQEKGLDYDSDTARHDAIKAQKKQENQLESIGMGPGRTGVKGVIRDHDEAAEIQRELKAKAAEQLRKKMESSNLGGKTFLEEEREKAVNGEKVDDLVMREIEKAQAGKRDVFGQKREGRFGHLREVGLKGFVAAVEDEEKGIWVVVHLYDSSLERCYKVDETLARLARSYSDTKFLRSKASALGFATLNSSSKPKPLGTYLKASKEDDEDDPYAYEKDEQEEEDEDVNEDVDLDMLPTMLVYRNGELVHNWVRVDWEAGDAGLEEFLDKHHILPHRSDNLGFPSDGEDDFDLMWSDDDDDVDHQL